MEIRLFFLLDRPDAEEFFFNWFHSVQEDFLTLELIGWKW